MTEGEPVWPDIVVVYRPGSVEELELIWNLRARFVHPPRLPLDTPHRNLQAMT